MEIIVNGNQETTSFNSLRCGVAYRLPESDTLYLKVAERTYICPEAINPGPVAVSSVQQRVIPAKKMILEF